MRFASTGPALRAAGIVAAVLLALGLAGTASAAGIARQISHVGTAVVHATPPGVEGGIAYPEFDESLIEGDDEDLASDRSGGAVVNRSIAVGHGAGVSAKSGKKPKSKPTVTNSFDGVNFRQQRLANGGNQFSVEPPDQALCVGNGYVLEAVNTVLRVFDGAGNALSGVSDLNTFYGYPAAINRATGARGPEITDPVCHFDADTQRWFLVVLTLDRVASGPFAGILSGANHLDIAVSTSANPLGSWNIYRLDVANDGVGCNSDPTPGFPGVFLNACFGDYPHIGADANGIFLTTNEFPFFANGFNGAQIYAMPKRALAAGAASVTVVRFDTSNYLLPAPDLTPGFTVWPAISPAGSASTDNGGTEYLLSSQAVFNDDGADNRLRIWAVTNTSSLDAALPAVQLVHGVVNTQAYAVPPKSNQKAGDFPQGQCINDTTTTVTSLGPPFVGCWKALFGAEPAHDEVISHPDSNDSRMQQVSFANGKLWGALDTAVNMGGPDKAGIAYFVMIPQLSGSSIKAKMVIQGILGLADNNLTYPAIAVLPNGRGVIAFTVLGQDYYPSAGFASLDAHVGAGDVQLAAVGAGPDDGFTGYKAQVGVPIRTRWGDYGAAATDGSAIWFASEYIAQTCALAQYIAAPFGSCGGTRASLGNWATRITKVVP